MRSKYHTTIAVLVAIFFMMAVFSLSQAQEKKIDVKDLPAAVTAAFQKTYPKAAVTGAGTEVDNGKTMYEIESKDGTIHRDLLYTDKGEVFEIEESITAEAIPAGVKSSLEKQFTKYKLVKGEKVIHGAKVTYELKLKSGKKMFSVLLDDSAKIVKCVTIKGKKEKEEKD